MEPLGNDTFDNLTEPKHCKTLEVGSPVDPREAIAMIWSGLRGAAVVSMA